MFCFQNTQETSECTVVYVNEYYSCFNDSSWISSDETKWIHRKPEKAIEGYKVTKGRRQHLFVQISIYWYFLLLLTFWHFDLIWLIFQQPIHRYLCTVACFLGHLMYSKSHAICIIRQIWTIFRVKVKETSQIWSIIFQMQVTVKQQGTIVTLRHPLFGHERLWYVRAYRSL